MREPASSQSQEGVYKKLVALVDQWLDLHKGETFDLDLLCRQLEIKEREIRNYVTIILSKLVHKEKLDKTNKTYRYIDNTIKYIDWVNADEGSILKDFRFPYGIEDDSHFGFEDCVVVSPGDVIVVAGNSNAGKTGFCLNVLANNMDKFPCTLMGNEYKPAKFKRRLGRMTWVNPLKEDGTPKFELIDRRDNWKDIIRPDNINIVDWIGLPGDESYRIGSIIDGIQSKLTGRGIALLSLQKDIEARLGRGRSYSEELASLYLTIDFERITVIKAKEWKGSNPNGKMYGFTLLNAGTQFHNIREVKKCPKCHGKCVIGQYKCESCLNKGFVDIEDEF